MKTLINRRVLTIVLLSIALSMSINNLHRQPDNKMTLFAIVLFSIVIGANFSTLVREYSQRKRDEVDNKNG